MTVHPFTDPIHRFADVAAAAGSDDVPQHQVLVEIRDGYVSWAMECPFAGDDEHRPCWPHDLDGSPFAPADPGAFDCTWTQWFNEDPESSLMAGPTIVVPVVDADWTGDGFLFDLGGGVLRCVSAAGDEDPT